MEVLFFSIAALLIAIITYIDKALFAKRSALEVMNKIIQIKFSAVSFEELVNLICKYLQKDLKKKFP
jgi:hypothetical protein